MVPVKLGTALNDLSLVLVMQKWILGIPFWVVEGRDLIVIEELKIFKEGPIHKISDGKQLGNTERLPKWVPSQCINPRTYLCLLHISQVDLDFM